MKGWLIDGGDEWLRDGERSIISGPTSRELPTARASRRDFAREVTSANSSSGPSHPPPSPLSAHFNPLLRFSPTFPHLSFLTPLFSSLFLGQPESHASLNPKKIRLDLEPSIRVFLFPSELKISGSYAMKNKGKNISRFVIFRPIFLRRRDGRRLLDSGR